MILLPQRLLGSTKTLLNEPKAGTQQPPVSMRVMMMVAVEDQNLKISSFEVHFSSVKWAQ